MQRAKHIVIASILALSPSLLIASCLQDPTAAPEPEPSQVQSSNGSEPLGEAQQDASGAPFTAKELIFVIEREWDGQDEAGGWQIAHNTTEYETRTDGQARTLDRPGGSVLLPTKEGHGSPPQQTVQRRC